MFVLSKLYLHCDVHCTLYPYIEKIFIFQHLSTHDLFDNHVCTLLNTNETRESLLIHLDVYVVPCPFRTLCRALGSFCFTGQTQRSLSKSKPQKFQSS